MKHKNFKSNSMRKIMFRMAPVLGGIAMAGSAFAQADTDGMVPALDYAGLTANITSVFGQVAPIALVVAGTALALGLIGWVIATLRSVFRSRSARS